MFSLDLVFPMGAENLVKYCTYVTNKEFKILALSYENS